MSSTAIELEHAIGFSGVGDSLFYHPEGKEYIYAAGGCIVITSLIDAHDQFFLRGHDSNLTCLTVSPKGNYLASGQRGENADILVWSYASRELLYRLSEHDYGISTVAFSHDERLLASVGVVEDGGKVFVWDVVSGNIVGTCQKMPTADIAAVAWGGMFRDIKRRDTNNYQLATGGKKDLSIWCLNPHSGELTAFKVESGSTIVRDFTCVQFSPDYETLYAGTTSGDFVVVKVKGRRVLQSVSACTCGVHSLQPLTTGVLIGGGDGNLIYFNMSNIDSANSQLQGAVSAVSISTDEIEVIAGTDQGLIYRIQLQTSSEMEPSMRSLLMCENHSSSIAKVNVAIASDRFATVSEDQTVRVWDSSDYSVLTKCHVQSAGKPTSFQYSSDVFLTGWSVDGCIRCHNSETGEFLWKIDNAHTDAVTALKLSTNQRFCVTGGLHGEVRVWDLRKRELVSHLKEHAMSVTDLALFSDDYHVISCSRDRSFLCWDLRMERRISSHTQRMGGINAISLSRDQTQVLTIGQEKSISFWDLREVNPVFVINQAHSDEATCIAIANSMELMATGGTDQLIKLWNSKSGEFIADGIGHSGTVRSLTFTPDDRQLISVGSDGNIFIWNVYTMD